MKPRLNCEIAAELSHLLESIIVYYKNDESCYYGSLNNYDLMGRTKKIKFINYQKIIKLLYNKYNIICKTHMTHYDFINFTLMKIQNETLM